MSTRFLLLLIAFALPASAQNAKPGEPPPADFKPLPERKDVLSWKLLSQVELIKQKDRFVPQFPAGISALDKKDVKVQGFMMPLTVGEQQSHFVLSAMPQSCAFCLPGGPESLVEVKTKKPVKYTFEPMVLTGKLSVLKEDPTGIFYRLMDAELTK
jgi:hypothetical protein